MEYLHKCIICKKEYINEIFRQRPSVCSAECRMKWELKKKKPKSYLDYLKEAKKRDPLSYEHTISYKHFKYLKKSYNSGNYAI